MADGKKWQAWQEELEAKAQELKAAAAKHGIALVMVFELDTDEGSPAHTRFFVHGTPTSEPMDAYMAASSEFAEVIGRTVSKVELGLEGGN